MAKNKLVAPVVKWAGGKRQILDEITKYIPETLSTYYEPFLGGGAVLFELQPEKAEMCIRDRVELALRLLADEANRLL